MEIIIDLSKLQQYPSFHLDLIRTLTSIAVPIDVIITNTNTNPMNLTAMFDALNNNIQVVTEQRKIIKTLTIDTSSINLNVIDSNAIKTMLRSLNSNNPDAVFTHKNMVNNNPTYLNDALSAALMEISLELNISINPNPFDVDIKSLLYPAPNTDITMKEIAPPPITPRSPDRPPIRKASETARKRYQTLLRDTDTVNDKSSESEEEDLHPLHKKRQGNKLRSEPVQYQQIDLSNPDHIKNTPYETLQRAFREQHCSDEQIKRVKSERRKLKNRESALTCSKKKRQTLKQAIAERDEMKEKYEKLLEEHQSLLKQLQPASTVQSSALQTLPSFFKSSPYDKTTTSTQYAPLSSFES